MLFERILNMHEGRDPGYKPLYSPRQCLCGELRDIAGSRCKNQMNVKSILKNACGSASPPEIIPALPFVKAERGKKEGLLSISIFPSKLSLIEYEQKRRRSLLCRQEAAAGVE